MPLGPLPVTGIYFGKNGKVYLYAIGFSGVRLFLKVGDQWLKFKYVEENSEDVRKTNTPYGSSNYNTVYEFEGIGEEPGERDFICKTNELFLTPKVSFNNIATSIHNLLFVDSVCENYLAFKKGKDSDNVTKDIFECEITSKTFNNLIEGCFIKTYYR